MCQKKITFSLVGILEATCDPLGVNQNDLVDLR